MMKIASNPEYSASAGFDVNLAASIQLKNMVQYYWKYSQEMPIHQFPDEDSDEENDKEIIIPQEDKEFVKTHLIQACAHAPSFAVLSLLEKIVHDVSRYELPENWPNAMNEITELLQQEDESKLFGGLVALKEVVRRFEYEFRENRLPLQEIGEKLFPRIEQIFVSLLENNSESAMKAKNIIIETFYLANNARILTRYHNIENFDNLVSIIMKGFTQELPQEFTKFTEEISEVEKLTKSDPWKFKISCLKALNRTFYQLADTEMAEEEDEEISKHFVISKAKEILEMAFFILEVYLTNFVANEVVSFAVRIITKSEKIPVLNSILHQHDEDILFKYSLPLLRITPGEVEEFTDNPVSYVRTQHNIADTLNSAKNSGIDLINDIVTQKENDQDDSIPPYLEKFLHFLAETLDKNNEDYKIKESVFTALGHLAPHLKSFKQLREGVEELMKNHIFPELSGDNEILKAKALW